MRRVVIALAVAVAAFAACSDNVRHVPDAKPAIDAPADALADAPADAPADATGSAMRMWNGGMEPSPKDNGLDLSVFALSLVVAVGPLRGRRRREAL